jgi:hypothetical protein
MGRAQTRLCALAAVYHMRCPGYSAAEAVPPQCTQRYLSHVDCDVHADGTAAEAMCPACTSASRKALKAQAWSQLQERNVAYRQKLSIVPVPRAIRTDHSALRPLGALASPQRTLGSHSLSFNPRLRRRRRQPLLVGCSSTVHTRMHCTHVDALSLPPPLPLSILLSAPICNGGGGGRRLQLMGRSSGFIAAYATLASGDVDLCLVPEAPIVLEGPKGCLPHLERVVEEKG